MKLVAVVVVALVTLASSLSDASLLHRSSTPIRGVDPVLRQLMTFHPGWITRTVTSHDPWGGNGDGNGNGNPAEDGYQVLMHSKGEGRIVRLWMTAGYQDQVPHDYQELWIETDGHTVFRGAPMDFFNGKGGWQNPLVYNYDQSSGGFLSYVPFAYSREAKIRFKGDPHYFQVTYREGEGASAGPTSQEIAAFLSDRAWSKESSALVAGRVSHGHPEILARGPTTVSLLSLHVQNAADLSKLRVRVGDQAPVPASFFFGMGSTGLEPNDQGWEEMHNSLFVMEPRVNRVMSRLPVPLAEGQALSIESDEPDSKPLQIKYSLAVAKDKFPGVTLETQFRDQMGPGTETTMPFFESAKPTQFVSLIEEITDGKVADRGFLEGDEMVRTDGMKYPLELGTGTEDYFNGGWYFMGPHANPLSGLSRFIVNDPEDGWSHARFEHSLYRHHVLDPVVGRAGLRFGFEAGELGAYQPIRYRTLGLAYSFSGSTLESLEQSRVTANELGVATAIDLVNDAEHSEKAQPYWVHSSNGVETITAACNPAATAFLLTRSYDAELSGQEARVLVNGREAGRFFESYANPHRRFAQDALWIELRKEDCKGGSLTIALDASASAAPFTSIAYDFAWYREPSPVITEGPATHVFDTTHVGGEPFYLNDHSLIQGDDGRWHLYGIYHHEPFGPDQEFDLVHAVSTIPSPAQWREGAFLQPAAPDNVALSKRGDLGETHLWAPHVVRDAQNDRYVMIYHGGFVDNDQAQIRLAESKDLTHWTRVGTEPLFTDICVARDPMLLKQGDLWTVFYTRCNNTQEHLSGVAYRTSTDLLHWSEPRMALVRHDTTPMFNSGFTESPFVFERDGWYYLSVTSYPIDWNASFLFRSRTPYHFDDVPYMRLTTHAPEWVFPKEGGVFMTHCGPGQGGLWIMPMSGL